ncbi:MAG TPA: K(+)-transporting ATPase subunit C [Xylanibacter oryzae]|nr:K(+)-transporting ATPase subunit C [Xylanibacter oryzae]
MKTFIKSIRFTFVFCIFLAVSYVLVLWIFARFAAPNKGNVAVSELNGRVVGATNVGQSFTRDIYFWGRPSCAGNGYDATKSGGSNKAPTNMAYLRQVDSRIVAFLKHHPYLSRKDVPAEMVTASGSGLDPDISPRSAYIQVRRIAMARGCSEALVRSIVDKSVERPLLGIFGPQRVNVLKMNISLDELHINKAEVK